MYGMIKNGNVKDGWEMIIDHNFCERHLPKTDIKLVNIKHYD